MERCAPNPHPGRTASCRRAADRAPRISSRDSRPSGPEPRVADLQVHGRILWPARDVDAHVHAELARKLVAEADAAGAGALAALHVLVEASLSKAAEAYDAPPSMELPARLDFGLRDLVPRIPHRWNAAHRDERTHEERRTVARLLVAGACRERHRGGDGPPADQCLCETAEVAIRAESVVGHEQRR